MSNSVDDRIVAMKFENNAFERGVATSLSTLQKLKDALNFSNSKKSMDELQNSANRFNMNGVNNAVDSVSSHFNAARIIAGTVLATITHQAFRAAENIARGLTIQPILDGLSNYETKINAIQTILANTTAAGTNLKQVTGVLKELNDYANLTVYNFSEMTRNIGTFTAAGVDLKTAVNSIKGIANLAALSGSSSQQASTAMYQLSQAIAAGKVSLQDWNSVVNAGIGGTAFQRALAQTAVAMGTLKENSLKLVGPMKNVSINGQNFRNSITPKPGEKPWLTSKVLTTALETFTGDLSKAQLAALGFKKEQIAAIQAQAKTAVKAATQIKTISQLHQALKEEVSSSWAQVWEDVIGNFVTAPKLLSPLHQFLQNMFTNPVFELDKLLKQFNHLGGRNKVIDIIVTSFKAMESVLKPIHDAFREIFPAKTAVQLIQMATSFDKFVHSLLLGKQNSENLKRTFAGFFAVLDIGKQIISGILGLFGKLFTAGQKGSDGVLGFTGNIGDMLVALDQAIKQGGFLTTFFDGLAKVLTVPIKLLGDLGDILANVFSGFKSSDLDATGKSFDRVNQRLEPMMRLLHGIHVAWEAFVHGFGKAVDFIAPAMDNIGHAFERFGTIIADAFSSGSFQNILDLVNTGLLAGILLLVRKFFKNGGKFGLEASVGFTKPIEDAFGALTGSMKAMQTQIQAKTLLIIAGAIGLLTASVVALSLIDSAKLTKALGAMAAGFGQLLVAMAILVKISGSAGFVKVPLIAGAMVLLAGAVLILTAAVAVLSRLSWSELAKGLTGVSVLLVAMAGTAQLLSGVSGGLVRAGLAMIPLAIGLNLLAVAMKIFATMSWKDMAKGLVGVAGALLVIAGAMQLMPATLPITAIGLVAVGAALGLIAAALLAFGSLDWSTIGRGLTALAGALLIIAGAMQLMPPTLPITAAGLILVGIALTGIAGAIKIMATMSWKEIGRGLTVLAGALVILAAGLYLMTGTIAGSASLLIAAAALAVLTPVLVALGAMSWKAIGKGLATLAAVFTILGVAGLLLTPVVPQILALGLAVALLGAGLALAGVGVLAFVTAFTALVAVGGAGISLLVGIITSVINQIPLLLQKFGEGIVAFSQAISAGAPAFLAAFVAILNSLLDAVIKVAPKLGEAIIVLVETGLHVILTLAPKWIQAGYDLLLDFLRGIANNIGDIVDVAVDIITAYINALAAPDNVKKIVDSGFNLIINFVNGIANGIEDHQDELRDAGIHMATAIADGMTFGLASKTKDVIGGAAGLGKKALGGLGNALGINSPSRYAREFGEGTGEGLILGFTNSHSSVDKAAGDLGDRALSALGKVMSNLSGVINSEMDLTPTIAPVIDLTQFRKDAAQMDTLVQTPSVTPTTSLGQAISISKDSTAGKDETGTPPTPPVEKTTVFNQYNTSPKAISEVDTYRSTKSLLSLAKGALEEAS